MWVPASTQDYGGDTEKPTWLLSNYRCIRDLDLYTTGPGQGFGTHELVHKYTDKYGRQKYHGNKNLKKSENYPRGFGQAVRKVVTKNEHNIRAHKATLRHAAKTTLRSMARDTMMWRDAELSSVMDYLTANKENI